MATTVLNWDDIGCCNCAQCGRECIGERTKVKLEGIPKSYWPSRAKFAPFVAIRIKDRPYCSKCFPKVSGVDMIHYTPPKPTSVETIGRAMSSMSSRVCRKSTNLYV